MALRDLVKDVHTEAEESPFAKLLMSGAISKHQYANYLYQQEMIYFRLEQRADKLGILDDIPDIKRHHKIVEDFHSLEVNDSFKLYPVVKEYCDYVEGIDEYQCWAHMYVRHFGDMYGGNMISKRIPFGSHNMYKFEDKKGLIEYVRSKLDDDMYKEAQSVFKYATALFKELEKEYGL
jgi:heme oxygenase